MVKNIFYILLLIPLILLFTYESVNPADARHYDWNEVLEFSNEVLEFSSSTVVTSSSTTTTCYRNCEAIKDFKSGIVIELSSTTTTDLTNYISEKPPTQFNGIEIAVFVVGEITVSSSTNIDDIKTESLGEINTATETPTILVVRSATETPTISESVSPKHKQSSDDSLNFKEECFMIMSFYYDYFPEWMRNVFVWYEAGQISESELISVLQFMVSNKIIEDDRPSMDCFIEVFGYEYFYGKN